MTKNGNNSSARTYNKKRGRWPNLAWFVIALIIGVPTGVALARVLDGTGLIVVSVVAGVSVALVLYLLARYNSRRLNELYAHARRLYDESHEHELDNSGDDVHDVKQLIDSIAEASRDAQEQLQHTNRLSTLGSLAAAMTHEVRNPLTGLIGFVQIAQMKRNDHKRVAELLVSVEEEAKRCDAIIERFLSYSRRTERDKELLEVNELIDQAKGLLAHHLKLNQLHLEVEAADDVPAVLAVGGELHQVLLNMALNASDATPAGGTVTLRTRRGDDGCARIEVSDTGSGIPPEIAERIFEPFFTTKGDAGTGLGLSVSKEIVNAHGGTISVAPSEPGRGATIVIELPAAAADAATATASKQPPPEPKVARG